MIKKQKKWKQKNFELITINPFPRSGGDAGFFLRADPHELSLQIGLPPVELGVNVVLCCASEVMQ